MNYGPNTAAVELLIRRANRISPGGRQTIDQEYAAADRVLRDKALEAVRFELSRSPRVVGIGALPLVWQPAQEAGIALVVQDILDDIHFNTLYGPWASVFGWDLQS